MRWLLSLVQRLGWRGATLAAVLGMVAASVGVAMGMDRLAPGYWAGFRTDGRTLAAFVSLVVVLPCLAVTFRLVEHLARGRGQLQREIERRNQAEARLRRLVTRDQLTGLANRRSFLGRARTAAGIARRYRQPLSLLLIDVDHFKEVNDRYGHQVGDRALVRLARVLERHLRETDTPARIGGDEFVVLLPHTDADAAAFAAERIRAAVAAEPEAPPLTVTVGVACAEAGGGQHLNDLLRAADLALYEAKGAGRDCVRVSAPVCLSEALHPAPAEF